jgi:hypothetical protein
MMKNSRGGLLAAATLAMMAATPAQAGVPVLGYPIPNGWAPSQRGGNNRREDSTKRHAKAKTAYRSKRAQRKKAKR